MIDIDMIIERHEQLDSDLRAALATMERSDKVKEIREAILEIKKDALISALFIIGPLLMENIVHTAEVLLSNE